MYNQKIKRYLKLLQVLLEDLPGLYYLFLTDSGELECYEEAMQVDTK